VVLETGNEAAPGALTETGGAIMKLTINRVSFLPTLAACLLGAPAVLAQGANADDGWVPIKHLEFTAEDVEGGLMGPDGELIQVVERAKHPSLIEIREGFEAEVVKTMENM
jgi:hypothetical protein